MSRQLFRKHKKKDSELRRKVSSRETFKRFLVVAEGTRTEPNYLKALRDYWRVNHAVLHIYPKHTGTDPSKLLELAIKEFKKSPEYDKVFCVFDRDSHPHFSGTIQRIKDLSHKYPLQAIVSNPCFELWFLLHFEFTTKGYFRAGDNSPCDCLIIDLKKHLCDYHKGFNNYGPLLERTSAAIANAERLKSFCQDNEEEQSSTDVHLLVQEMRKLCPIKKIPS